MRKNHYPINLSIRIVLFFLLSVIGTTANARDLQQAKQAAMQQMKKSLLRKTNVRGGANVSAEPQLVYSKAKTGADPYYYVFSEGKDMGYTLVSGDDRLPAIVGYTASGDFNAEKLPDGLSDYLKAYQEFIDNATAEQIAEAIAFKAKATHPAVAPLMTAKWGQYEPYNKMCPQEGPWVWVTGCVATAGAQILHYWKYPDKLMTDIPAYTTETNKINMPAIPAGEEYDWDNMLDTYNNYDYATEEQQNAVAKLIFHVGCAVEMDYNSGASGAVAIPETFTKYFGMDKETVQRYFRRFYTLTEWDNMLYSEMEAKRPVYYTGASTTISHAFVIHGYSDGLYYVNWGWTGEGDGYYDIAVLNPYDSSVNPGSGLPANGFNMDNVMIVGIQPDNGVVDEMDNRFSCDVFEESDIQNLTMADGVVTANVMCTMVNFTTSNLSKYVAVGYEKEDGSIQNVTENPELLELSGMDSENIYSRALLLNVKFNAENNKLYKLITIESEDQITWQACAGTVHNVIIKVEDGKVSFPTAHILSVTSAGLGKNSNGYIGEENMISVTINNSGLKEYHDQIIHIRVSETSTMPDKDTFVTGITVPAEGSTTLEFAYIPRLEETYNIWVLDAENNEIGTGSVAFHISPDPKLEFVSIKCVNASDDLEYIHNDYLEHSTQMNIVYDTMAEFEFTIKNYGAECEGDYILCDEYDERYGVTGGGREKRDTFEDTGK